jgi:hypothetical protein
MRASCTAVSLASVPLLVKNDFFSAPGVICASFSASATIGSMGKQVETCCSLSICAFMGAVTRGLQWPTLTVTMPPKKSRYLRPSTSQTCCM